jgi:hypothetical protein
MHVPVRTSWSGARLVGTAGVVVLVVGVVVEVVVVVV